MSDFKIHQQLPGVRPQRQSERAAPNREGGADRASKFDAEMQKLENANAMLDRVNENSGQQGAEVANAQSRTESLRGEVQRANEYFRMTMEAKRLLDDVSSRMQDKES